MHVNYVKKESLTDVASETEQSIVAPQFPILQALVLVP